MHIILPRISYWRGDKSDLPTKEQNTLSVPRYRTMFSCSNWLKRDISWKKKSSCYKDEINKVCVIISYDEKTKPFHLLKLENALFSLASLVQQRHLLYCEKESITAKKGNACVTSVNTRQNINWGNCNNCNNLDILFYLLDKNILKTLLFYQVWTALSNVGPAHSATGQP